MSPETPGATPVMYDQLLEIARSGVLAPSADNQHVFRIEVGNASLHLWPTVEFRDCRENHRRVLGLMSLGAVVENMRLRAGELGLLTDVHWLQNDRLGPMVRIDLQPTSTAPRR